MHLRLSSCARSRTSLQVDWRYLVWLRKGGAHGGLHELTAYTAEHSPRTTRLEPGLPYETQFELLVRHEALSRGFARPDSLEHSPSIFGRCIHACQATVPVAERQALVVGLEIDRNRVVLFMLLIGLLGISSSIGMAAWSGDVGLGMAVGGGFFALAALVQATLVWKYG